jgi:hypothetical protein
MGVVASSPQSSRRIPARAATPFGGVGLERESGVEFVGPCRITLLPKVVGPIRAQKVVHRATRPRLQDPRIPAASTPRRPDQIPKMLRVNIVRIASK